MLEDFKNTWEKEILSWRNKEVFLAISGGKDSMTLSHILVKLNIHHTLLHCNFKLRQRDSDRDEAFVKKYALDNKLPVLVKSFNTEKFARENSLSIQEAARKLRYDWFGELVNDPNKQILFTAHHASDNIETFFINLMRGSGLYGLTGMPQFNGCMVRPLLSYSVNDIKKYITNHNVVYREDLSNHNNKYTRNFIRNEVIPLIKEKSNEFEQKLGATIKSLQEIHEFIDDEAEIVKSDIFEHKNGYVVFKLESILNINKVILSHLLREFGVRRSEFENLMKFLKSHNKSTYKTKSHTFSKQRKSVYIQKNRHYEQALEPASVVIDSFDRQVVLNNPKSSFKLSLSKKKQAFSPKILQWDAKKIILPITIRKWMKGDRFVPLGMSGTKKVSDFIVDKKINIIEKQNLLVVLDSSGSIIGIVGHTIAEPHKLKGSTEQVITLSWVQK
jgi:tRNA(Ile)-lysidine synthase